MHKKTLELVILALLGALLVVMQVALASLPNIELVSLLVYLYAKIYGRKAFIPVYVFVLLEGLLYGFTIWWMTYLYVWAILVVLSIVTKHETSTFVCAAVISLFGLSFGLLCTLPTLIIGGPGAAVTFFINGLPFDITHFAGNLLSALVLYYPLYLLMRRLKAVSYGNSI